MARLRSPEKRSAILEAAVLEIDAAGLGAPTSRIAARAGVADGTLFTYFATKEQLWNELYYELKAEVYRRLNANLPLDASLKERARHIWNSYLDWAIEFPQKRKVSAQLHLFDRITAATRERTAAESGAVSETLAELGQQGAARGMPSGFASSIMSAMQDAAMDLIARHPGQRERLQNQTFEAFWKAVL